MHKKFNDILDLPPDIFREDVYLCDQLGNVISARCKGNFKTENVLSLITNDDLHFIKENMFFPGVRPLMLVDSALGPIIFDLSLCPRYNLLIAIIPHIGTNELLSLYKSGELTRINLSNEFKSRISNFSLCEINKEAHEFAERISSVHRFTEYSKFFLQTNVDTIQEMSEIAHTFCAFYGCKFDMYFDFISNSIEFVNEICFESHSFSLAMLSLLVRNYSASRRADILFHFDTYGIYYDLSFDIAKQFNKIDLINEAPELKYFQRRANEMFLISFHEQKENHFRIRILPWLRRPDSSDLKEIKENFIYDI